MSGFIVGGGKSDFRENWGRQNRFFPQAFDSRPASAQTHVGLAACYPAQPGLLASCCCQLPGCWISGTGRQRPVATPPMPARVIPHHQVVRTALHLFYSRRRQPAGSSHVVRANRRTGTEQHRTGGRLISSCRRRWCVPGCWTAC